jgi:hypothetical protein
VSQHHTLRRAGVTLAAATVVAAVGLLAAPAAAAHVRVIPESTTGGEAAPGVQIGPGQFQEFAISGGPLPESGEMVFAAAQTYSDGGVVDWDQPQAPGAAEPEKPVGVLGWRRAGQGS